MALGPQGCSGNDGDPPPLSGGAAGLAWACCLAGMLTLCHQFRAVLSPGCIWRLECLGPAEVGSCSHLLPSAKPVLITPPRRTPTGPLPALTLVQDLEGFSLFGIIHITPFSDALPWARLHLPQFPPLSRGQPRCIPGDQDSPLPALSCSLCSSYLRLWGHAVAAERVGEHHHGAAAAGAGQRGSHQVGWGCVRARPPQRG